MQSIIYYSFQKSKVKYGPLKEAKNGILDMQQKNMMSMSTHIQETYLQQKYYVLKNMNILILSPNIHEDKKFTKLGKKKKEACR